MKTMNSAAEYFYEADAREHPPLAGRDKASRTLLNADRLRVIQFAFAAGHGLTAHSAPNPVTLTFLKGRASVRLGPDEVAAREGTFVSIPPGLEHSIQAESDVVMLLTMIR